MTEPETDKATSKPAPDAEVVTTKVNVAFPFSQIKIQEPSEELTALAAVVEELADLVAAVAPGPAAQDVAQRAHVLASRLR